MKCMEDSKENLHCDLMSVGVNVNFGALKNQSECWKSRGKVLEICFRKWVRTLIITSWKSRAHKFNWICNTPYPIYDDLTKNSKPYLWPDHYINILFQTCVIISSPVQNNVVCCGRTYLYSPCKEVPPGSCNNNIPSFIGNLWWVLLLGNRL